MTVRVRDGWIHGQLPGPEGRTYLVERAPRDDFTFVRLAIRRPNFVLHTTQAPDLKGVVGISPPRDLGLARFQVWLAPFPQGSCALRLLDEGI